MADLNKYRLYCNDEATYVYIWKEVDQDLPTLCPNNTSHTIDTTKTAITEVNLDNEVSIKEETIKTGGHYQARGLAADVPASIGWHDLITFSWPIPINLLSAEAKCRSTNDGDIVELLVGSDTIIGAITANVTIGDEWITVQQSVIDNIKTGRWVTLSDGINTDDCERVLEVDKENLKIKIETTPIHAFSPASPTYVKMTTKMITNVELVSDHRLVIGESKIGGSYVPANINMKLRYKNNDGQSKRFSFIAEYLY